ncbi:16572_t:CDS:2 [Racocetra persica]|uniref:16572_t:CDS:1 n=1 Tax=Racocetra persica TaxID=160502 RepID=A0ACA9L0W3_9GLOM|nr:16572_t:CDS:2 [Racocetra persica]
MGDIAQEHWASKWVESRIGQIPEGSWMVGGNAIGRGWYEEGRHVGYVVPGRGLVIGYNGNEVMLNQYEVLSGDQSQYRWIGGRGPCRPKHFVPLFGGHEADRRELYIAKTWYNDQEVVGKVGPHLEKGMSFGMNGHEIGAYEYQVLALLG